jgi:hypothetical protein
MSQLCGFLALLRHLSYRQSEKIPEFSVYFSSIQKNIRYAFRASVRWFLAVYHSMAPDLVIIE